jgi:dCTP deaminase
MLSDRDIQALIDDKRLIIEPFFSEKLGCASIDLALGEVFVKYTDYIDTKSDEISYEMINAPQIILEPNQFILGITKEKISIPDGYYGFIETRGNFARAGISVTCSDGHIDPGTEGLVTLEIKNNNNVEVKLYAGDLICQLFIFKLSSKCLKIYNGKYAKQTFPSIFKI